MTSRRFRRAVALSALALGTACESGTDPEVQQLVDLVLDFCSSDVPVWIAYRNQGADWVRLTPNADGAVSFTATNDVALAFVRQDGADYDTEIIFAANTELERISGVSCREESGGKRLNGTVTGVVGSQASQIAMSYSTVYLPATQTSFSLTNLPERPLDLIASRVNIVGTNQSADRIIIRRNESLAHNATMPELDFTSPFAAVPTAFGIDVAGIAFGDFAFLATTFVSALETPHTLAYAEPVGDGAHTSVGVPLQDLLAGDYHDAFVVSIDEAGAVRGVERFFLAPTNQILTLGGVMGSPTVTEAATTPYLRLRAQMTRALDYARAMRAVYVQDQQAFSITRVSVTITSGYEAADSWDATIPDLSGVSGWQNSWGLVAGGGAVDWDVSVYGGRPELLFGAPPGDGEVMRFASRQSSVGSSIAGAARRGVTAPRPRLFSPGR